MIQCHLQFWRFILLAIARAFKMQHFHFLKMSQIWGIYDNTEKYKPSFKTISLQSCALNIWSHITHYHGILFQYVSATHKRIIFFFMSSCLIPSDVHWEMSTSTQLWCVLQLWQHKSVQLKCSVHVHARTHRETHTNPDSVIYMITARRRDVLETYLPANTIWIKLHLPFLLQVI